MFRVIRVIRAIRVMGKRAGLVAILAMVGMVMFLACGPSAENIARGENEIRAHLQLYLPQLAEAYTTRDARVVSGAAAPREVAAVHKRIEDITDQGRVLKPVFRSMTVEKIDLWNPYNAYVTTLETWDLRVYAIGSETLLSEQLDEHNRVKYQLRRNDEGEWMILYRNIQE